MPFQPLALASLEHSRAFAADAVIAVGGFGAFVAVITGAGWASAAVGAKTAGANMIDVATPMIASFFNMDGVLFDDWWLTTEATREG